MPPAISELLPEACVAYPATSPPAPMFPISTTSASLFLTRSRDRTATGTGPTTPQEWGMLLLLLQSLLRAKGPSS